MRINSFSLKTSSSVLADNKKSAADKITNSFGKILKDKLSEVNDLKLNSEQMTQKLVTGDVKDMHEVMIAAEKARLAIEYTMAVRNEAVKAYESIMKMR